MSHDFSYLPGRSRLECLKDGFENIQAGTMLPLQVTEELWQESGTRTAANGTIREWKRTHRYYIISLDAPDGTRHRFLTDPEEASLSPSVSHCPAGRGPSVKYHPIATFVEFFQVPIPAGTAHQNPPGHALLDLIEAIVDAATAGAPTAATGP